MVNARILVVEDEYISAKVIRSALNGMKYDVVDTVSTGEKAIQKASETCPDLVLMDIMLSGEMDGIETAKQIRKCFNIPVIYLTAHADDATLKRAKITEPFGYIVKPFDDKVLQISIEFSIHKHKAENLLKQSEERFHKFIENALDIVICDINGTIVEWNRSAEIAFKYSKDEIIGKPVTILIPERYKKEHQDGVARFLKTGEARFIGKRQEVSGITKEGVEIPLDTSITAQKVEEDKYFFTAIMRDITEREDVEKELRQYGHIVSYSHDMLALLDKKFIYTAANRAYLAAFNRSREDLIGHTVSEVIGKEFFEKVIKVPAEHCMAGNVVKYQEWFEFSAYGRRYMDITYSPYTDENNETKGFVVNARDITERKRSEEQIRKLSATVEQSPNIVVITDVKGKIEYVNPKFTKVTGYTREDVIGKNPHILKSGKTSLEVYKSLWKTIKSGKTWHGDLYNKKKNGELYTESAYISPLKDDEGVITHFIAAKDNITMRKQAERRLNAQYYVTKVLAESITIKEVSSKILQTICTALEWDFGEIWIFDQQKQVLVNTEIWHVPSIGISEFLTLTRQITFSSGIGLPGTVLSSANPVWIEDVVHDTNFLRASVAAKVGLHGAFGFPILSGREVTGVVCFFSHEIREPDNDLLNMMASIGSQIGIFISRKQSEDALLQSEKLKTIGTITSGITHEFNNILAIISGNIQLLEGNYKGDKELTDAFCTIKRATEDGAEISSKMLLFAKTKEDSSTFETFDIRTLINQSIDFTMPRWKSMAQIKSINFQMETGELKKVSSILCNPSEIREVFINIINNALDAMPEGGSLSFSTWMNEDSVFVSIADTGDGMPEEVRRNIFDPFFTTKTPTGTGLGMSMAYGIMARHGGKIDVESEVGNGSIFTLQFPVTDKPKSTENLPEPEQYTKSRGLHILVVDDEVAICNILDKVLSRAGHTVKTVNNGNDAIELTKSEEFDLVICDLVMPHAFGYDVIKALNTLKKRPKVGIITGWAEELKPLEGDLKVDFIVKKPFNFKELTRHINETF